MQSTWTILVDDREKKPLPFPDHLVCLGDHQPATSSPSTTVRLLTRSVRLQTGDYALEGFPNSCLIERKASLQEIATNLFDRIRRPLFLDALNRLQSSCRHPCLLFECDLVAFHAPRPTSMPLPPPDVALDALLDLLTRYRITPILLHSSTASQRRECAKFAARLLIRSALHGHQ